jgi:hypothetical protein
MCAEADSLNRPQSTTLSLLPAPTPEHIVALDQLLADTHAQFGWSETDLEDRAKVAEKIQALLNLSKGSERLPAIAIASRFVKSGLPDFKNRFTGLRNPFFASEIRSRLKKSGVDIMITIF